MQLEYGIYGGGHLLTIGTKNDMKNFYRLVDSYCQEIDNIDLVLDNLYRKYIRVEDIDKTLKVMNLIADFFQKIFTNTIINKDIYAAGSQLDWRKETLFDVYRKIFDRFSHIIQMFKYYLEDYGFSSKVLIKTVIANIPYIDWIKELPQELFANLTNEDEPFWTWDIDKLEALVKQQNPAYKDVHHAVYVLADE